MTELDKLPCDVMLPPNVTLARGCAFSALLRALESRETWPLNAQVFPDAQRVMHQDRHNKLLELRNRAARQPISYQSLFMEAVDMAAGLLREMAYLETYLIEPTHDMEREGQLEFDKPRATAKSVFRVMIETMPKEQ